MSILQSTKFTVAMLIGICTGAASLGYAEEAPSGADWWNSRTRDKNTTLSVGLKSLVVFRVGKDKAVDRWQWYVDGVDQKVNNRAFTWRAGPRAKTYAIKVSGGGKGVTWKVRVLQGTGDIAGAVVDADNKPIKGAVITAGKRSATTDGRGRYAFRKLPEDGHVLTAHKDGYVWQTKHVKVTSGKTTTEKFQLPRFQPAKITYNGKMISIANGTATLTTINRAVNDRAALEKISPKVWLLKRTITLDSKATLYVNDSDTKELRLLSMKDGNEANIKGNGRLEFLNVTVTSWDTTGKGPARVYLKRAYISSRYPILKYPTGGGGWLFNSVFKCLGALQGGQNGGIYIAPPSGYKEPVYIVNSRFFDCCPRNYFDTPKKKSAGIYRVGNRITTLRGGGKLYSGGGKASQSFSDVPNNIISHNVTDSWMGVNRVGNLIFEGNTITWSLHNAFAINGTSTSGPNPVNSIALETEVTGCDHNGMQMSGACRNCIFKNCVVHSADTAKYGTRVNDNGYYLTWDGKTDSTRPRDGLLEDCI
ncbi:MAG: carboxypeptidase regulatory-like domain-containing protein, partial [Phycisphaerae bacterium]|nr:carboxypeptidase regulatory-like domain-containing protein [Phycisphaerae bacterium]